MQIKTKWFTVSVTAIAIICLILLQGCGSGSSGGITSHVKNSFDAVTSELDRGGNLYLYADTTRIMQTIDKFAASIRDMIQKEAGSAPGKAAESLKGFDFIIRLFKRSGFSDIGGIGISSVTIAEGLNHSKMVLYHDKGKGDGFFWQLGRKGSHKLEHLSMLPANTVLARFGNLHLKFLWDRIKKEAGDSGIPQLQQGIQSLEPMLKKGGVDLNKLLGSLSGPIGFLVTLDNASKKKISLEEIPIEIPDPSFALVIDVSDDSIFSLIAKGLPPEAVREIEGTRRIQIPMGKMPITFEPIIVQTRDRLIFASNSKVVGSMFAAKTNGNGLTANAEFKKMSAHIPNEGNSFSYIGPLLFETIRGLFERGVRDSIKSQGQDGSGPEPDDVLKPFLSLMPGTVSMYGVTRHTNEGVVTAVNHTTGIEHLMILPALASVGITAAVFIPIMMDREPSHAEPEPIPKEEAKQSESLE